MCVCIYVYLYMCEYVHLWCVCVYVCIYIYMWMYVCVFVYMCVCICICMYICICICLYMCIYIYVCVCVCVCMYRYIYTQNFLLNLRYSISWLFILLCLTIIQFVDAERTASRNVYFELTQEDVLSFSQNTFVYLYIFIYTIGFLIVILMWHLLIYKIEKKCKMSKTNG